MTSNIAPENGPFLKFIFFFFLIQWEKFVSTRKKKMNFFGENWILDDATLYKILNANNSSV